MKSWAEIKQAMISPPPERLAAIEYRSHFLQMIGVTAVCIILITKGFWYIIFALIFSVGVSYSQGVSAYQKYNMIMSVIKPNQNPETEKSPSRRRDKVIRSVFGRWGLWASSAVAGIAPYFFLPEIHFMLYSLAYLFSIALVYTVTYYFIIYYISLLFYNMKGGVKNAKRKTKKRN